MRRLLLLVLMMVLGSGCVATRIKNPQALDRFDRHVTTSDGWKVALFRVPPAGGAQEPHHGTPVLMAHGTAVNRYNFSHTGSDLAGYLAGQGFDVWLLEYRGDRTAVPPRNKDWARGAWTVEDFAEKDVPAALDAIQSETGRDDVLWVGHSLGGVLGYVVAQGPHAHRIKGMVAIGAPGTFSHTNDMASRVLHLRGLAPKKGQLGFRPLSKLAKGALRMAPDAPVFHMVFNADNFDVDAAASFVNPAMENIGSGVVQQYLLWTDEGRLLSADGERDYTAGLARVTAPALFIAGRVDHVVPPWTVRYAYDHVSSPDKTWMVMGQGWGHRHDYGHGDLLVGDWVFEELFPTVGSWLVDHAVTPEAPPITLELTPAFEEAPEATPEGEGTVGEAGSE